jgi:hypothetical protein
VIRPLRALPFALLLVACSKSSGPAEIVTRDSAGVTIIEHPAGAISAAALWRLGEPVVTIGGGEGEDQEFSFIGGAVRLSDGRIVLADNEGDGTRFMVYGADGAFDRRLGRPGDGPGEFRSATILGLTGDTLVLYDFMAARLTKMRTDGTLLGTSEFSRLGPMKLGMPTGVMADGRLLTSPVPFGDTAQHGSGPYRQESAVQLIDPVAVTLDTLQAFPGTEVKLSTMTIGGQSRSFPMPLGYGKRTLYGNGPDRIHVVTNERAEVATYGLPWAAHRVVRFAEPAERVDQAARDAQIAEGIANIERSRQLPAEFKATMLENVRNASFADSLPHFTLMLVGTDGSLWLRQARSAADSVPHYVVLSPDGRLAGRVDLPKRGRLLWTDGSQALVSTMDENDLPRLEVRSVTRTSATP